MSLKDQFNKWKETTLKKSLDKFKERRERFEYSSGLEVPRVLTPLSVSGLDTPRDEAAGLLDQRYIDKLGFIPTRVECSRRCIGRGFGR